MKMLEEIDLQPADDRKTLEWINVLAAAGLWLPEDINDFTLRLIGLTSCLYAVLDIKSDILDRPQIRSDAYMLGEQTGLPTLFWGVLWIAVAVVASLFFLLIACKQGRRSDAR